MPETITFLDLAKRTGNDEVVGLIEEGLESAPELRTLPVRLKKGTSYNTLVRVARGGGGFRNIGEGAPLIKSRYEKRLVEMHFFDAQMEIDEAAVKADPDLLNDESTGAVEGSMIELGQQIYAGKSKNAKGFKGFMGSVDNTMIVDAGGTGPSTETVWFIREGVKGVHLPVSQEDLLQLAGWVKQRVKDAKGNPFTAWVNNLCAWIGLQVGHKYSIGCIKNVTEANPVTDALAAKLMKAFPTGMKPTRCFMSSNSAYYLQNSRSSIGQTEDGGTGRGYAPSPTEVLKVPIVETDSISQVAAW